MIPLRMLVSFAFPVFVLCVPEFPDQERLYDAPSRHQDPPPAAATLGAIASQEANCSAIGAAAIRRGGNAADAMVAAVLCNGVTNMYHGGIGGGGFALVRDARGQFEVVDFRETAPAGAHEDMYEGNIAGSVRGGLASGIPSELRGLEHIHRKYGTMPWADLVAPSIGLARDGFRIGEVLARAMDSTVKTAGFDLFTEDPSWAIDFARNGERLRLGDTLTRRRYADTLEIIARDGADAFYKGQIAAATVAALAIRNGSMTLEDLENYQVELREPIEIDYRGFRMVGCGTPASGAVALGVMKVVEGYDDLRDPAAVNLSTHRLDEATKFGYAMRSELGDPDFEEDMAGYEDGMLSEKQAAEIRGRITDDRTHDVAYYDPDGFESLETAGTTHVVTADASGMAISLTTTVNLYFGSLVMVPETGIIMNNEMNDFSVPGISNVFGYVPSPANYIRPGKRPLSSITPTIVETAAGALHFIIGAAGGSRIITSTIQSLWHALDGDLTPAEALAAPRMHDQLVPAVVTFEYAHDNGTVADMAARGHNVTFVPPGYSAVQAIRRLPNGTFEAAADPRQEGSAGIAI